MAKRSNSTSADSKSKKKKNRKSKKMAPDAVAKKLQAAPKNNPFETIWSRRKFNIVGKKHKGEEIRIGLARSRAIEKRKNTLLKEYERSGKSSAFIDKRIGEQNDALGEFDKAIMRSQRERQLKLKKKSKFNLSDGEEDELNIQGLGSFLERDDFEEEVEADFDNDVEDVGTERNLASWKQLNNQNVQAALMQEEHSRHKSKKEIYQEIIAKSKFAKAQKAKDKEEDEQLVQQLDKEFALLMQSSGLLSLTRPSKRDINTVNDSIAGDSLSPMLNIDSTKQMTQPDNYDKLVNEMVLEMRAHPSDRIKTPEEIAQEQKEQVERLEEERLKRMIATDDCSDEDANVSQYLHDNSTQRVRSISGDDLGDSFIVDRDSNTKKGWVDEILEREGAKELDNEDFESSEASESAEDVTDDEGSDKDNDVSEKAVLKDWEQSDDKEFSTDLEESGDEDDGEPTKVEETDKIMELQCQDKETLNDTSDNRMIANRKQPSVGKDSLPYLIKLTQGFDELCRLFENLSNTDIIEAISRIRKFNPIKSGVEGKKMQVFYGLLLRYFAELACKKPLNFGLLNLLVRPLMDMSIDFPECAVKFARDRLKKARTRFCEAMKNPGQSCWPSLKTLLLLRLWSMIFPCSDFRHVVMTPALLLMCEYLMRCPILCCRDFAIGSFLCSMLLSVVKQSRKFCPEAIMFLRTVLVAALDRKTKPCPEYQLNKVVRPLLSIQERVNSFSCMDFFFLMEMQEDNPFFSSDNFRAGVLVSVLEIIRGFAHLYDEFNCYPETFLPISTLLIQVAEQRFMPDELHGKFKDLAQLIRQKADTQCMLRRPLQMQKQKPVPIKLQNPKFEENFVKGRDYDPDRERAAGKKLKKHVKREAKGAARELRKDNYFLLEAKERDRALQEEEREEKRREVRAFLEDQQHAFKSGQLGKGRKRRR